MFPPGATSQKNGHQKPGKRTSSPIGGAERKKPAGLKEGFKGPETGKRKRADYNHKRKKKKEC